MYEKHFHFKERPFTIVPNPRCLYMSAKHKLAFAHLQYGLMEGTGFVVLTGGIGTGKTTLLRFLLGKIERAMAVAVVFNTNVRGGAAAAHHPRVEAGEPGPDKAANLAMLNDFLIERFRQGRQAIVIIDEAQNLSREALEEVRLLSNLQGSRRPLLQLVLAGQPELRRKLADPALTQLAQRITSTFHLAPLDADETCQYVRFRLAQAGGSPDLFEDAAVEAVHSSGARARVIKPSATTPGHAFATRCRPSPTRWWPVVEMGAMFLPEDSGRGLGTWPVVHELACSGHWRTGRTWWRCSRARGIQISVRYRRFKDSLAARQPGSRPQAYSGSHRRPAPSPAPPIARQPEQPPSVFHAPGQALLGNRSGLVEGGGLIRPDANRFPAAERKAVRGLGFGLSTRRQAEGECADGLIC
jgi:type II secretory pathway predicted ATPase ExeA